MTSDESPVDHAFASATNYPGDIALLNYLLQDLRVIARKAARGDGTPTNYEAIEWDVHGLQRRTVICDADALIEPGDRLLVGFFGDRRATTDGIDVDETELDVVSEFRHFPGIVSYSSIELLDGQWANLVLHKQPDDRTDWRHSQIHISAAETVAPRIYHNVRIHNGCILGGPIGTGTVVIESTKYWDYDVEPIWHGFRTLPDGIRATTE